MKSCREFLKWFKHAIRGIHLVDKCLILFMSLLLFQLAFSLIFVSKAGSAAKDFDVIVRTSAAGIFGYFLSGNFVRSSKEKRPDIGATEEEDKILSQENKYGEREGIPVSRLQIVIASAVGLFCLIVLMFLRNVNIYIPEWQPSSGELATISQFRDFISGCIGFLIGCPTGRGKDAI